MSQLHTQIFISYRREDTTGSTGRIYDHLSRHFSASQVFIDVDTIPLGENFVKAIETAIGRCNIFIAIIGRKWINLKDVNGQRLLDSPNDFVRLEIRSALQRNITVIPVLVENAIMPAFDDLPKDVQLLARLNAIEISHSRFNSDMERLIRRLENILPQVDISQPPGNTRDKKANFYNSKFWIGVLGTIFLIGALIFFLNKFPGRPISPQQNDPVAADSVTVPESTAKKRRMSDELLEKIKAFSEATPYYDQEMESILQQINGSPEDQQQLPYVRKFVVNCQVARTDSEKK